MEEDSKKCNWSGTEIKNLFKNGDPWVYDAPLVSHSKYHIVLYDTSTVTGSTPPKPHISQHILWDDDHVRLPYSDKNLFPVKGEFKDELKSRWEIIQCSLLQSIRSSRALEAAINSYTTNLPKFSALHYFFEEVLEEEESEHFFEKILPGIINLALQLPEIIPTNIPLLKQGVSKSVSLSQIQVACLLANAFLCTFPWRKCIAATYPGVNFSKLFSAHCRPKRINCISAKLKCICNYFRRVLLKAPSGVITFERKFVPKLQMPRWDFLQSPLANTKVHICSTGTIENQGTGCLQVDFANKYVGGGVLGYGCVQEEIRYVICPELIVSRLFVEQLASNEALEITGVEHYNDYSGYGDTFTWKGDCIDETPFDSSFRRKTTIVAIDATRFSSPKDQFFPSAILRELNKAYVGFHSKVNTELAPVATGNWGCGAFCGDIRLKFLIQLMACVATKRNMVYFTFGDKDLQEELYKMYSFLIENEVAICQLWIYLCRFTKAEVAPSSLYSFLEQAHNNHLKNPENTFRDKPSTSFSNDHSTTITSKKFYPDQSSTEETGTQLKEAADEHKPKNDTVINMDVLISSNSEESAENALLVDINKRYPPLDITVENSNETEKHSTSDKEDILVNNTEVSSNCTNPFRRLPPVQKRKISDYFDKICK